jgi:hypothetical protein
VNHILAHFEVVAFTLFVRSKSAICVFTERAGHDQVFATWVVRVVEASAGKQIKTREVSVSVRRHPAFGGVKVSAFGRLNLNAVRSICGQL